MEASSRYRVQNIVRCYKEQWLAKPLPLKHIKAIEAIAGCQSEERGVSAYECSHEQRHLSLIAHSCRHRSCSLCAARSRVNWLEEQKKRLLDCAHFHCVFTLPQEYRVLWQYNQKWMTATFFDVVRSTLMDMMKNTSGHAVTPGILMAMHTWGRQLTLHPHIHCVVTAGGLDAQNQWKETGQFLLPGRQVKALYRGRFQARILDAFKTRELKLPPDHGKREFYTLYKATYRKSWCVRIEEQYAHGNGVLVYLSRYLKGGPLHPSQIVRCDDDAIGFRYKDHRDKRMKVLTVKPKEFIRRLLQHVPEPGQHMVRHYGLYAGAAKHKRALCREHLGGLLESIGPDKAKAESRLLCGTCGESLNWKWSVYPTRKKANSYGVESVAETPGLWQVQQPDEPVIGRVKKKITALRL
ncbi:IS91 family transposase [Granulosicoccus sp. 3-233]|uniref:IS91 family transposase n=1 Tax=Granulosicoccus sp. 3-233 TaxID=3417969 RepID=UPI003D32C5F0